MSEADSQRTGRDALRQASQLAAKLRPRKPKGILQWVVAVLVGFVLVCGAAFYYLWTFQNGPALAQRLARNFNKKARGRMTIGSVRWQPSAAIDMVLGRNHKVVIKDLKIYDTQGRMVAHFPRIEGYGKLWPLIRRGEFDVVRGRAEEAFFRIDYYRRPDGPHKISGSPFEVGLISAFEPRNPYLPKPKRPKIYSFDNLYIKRASISFHHRDFELYFHKVEANGSLYVKGATTSSKTMVRFSVKPRGGEGLLRVGGKTVALTSIRAPYIRTDPDNPMNMAFAVGGLLGSAQFRMSAQLQGFHGVKEPQLRLHTTITGFARSLAKFTGFALEGSDETLQLDAEGPLRSPVFKAHLWGLAAHHRIAGRTLRIADIRVKAHMHERRLTLDSLSGQILDGALTLSGELDLAERTFDGRLRLKDVKVTPLLTKATQRDLIGGVVSGHVDLAGALRKRALAVPSLDLRLRRSGRSGALPRKLRLRGGGGIDGKNVQLDKLVLSGFGLRVATKGQVDLATKRVKLAVAAQVGRLKNVLWSAGLPALARALSLRGQLRGTWKKPRVFGHLTVRGAGRGGVRSNTLRSEITFLGGSLSFRKLKGDLAGGTVSGRGEVSLLQRGTWKLQPRPFLRGKLSVVEASLKQLLPGSGFKGRVRAHLDLRGRPGALTGRGRVSLRNAQLAGQSIQHGHAAVHLRQHGVRLEQLNVRWKGGGQLKAAGDYDWRAKRIALRGRLDSLPLSAVLMPRLRRALQGRVSGSFHLRGDQARPLMDAVVRLAAVKLRGQPLGAGKITLTPEGADTRIKGEVFRRFQLSGRLVLQPEPRLVLRATFRDLALHDLVPELQRLPGRVQAKATGRIAVTLHLNKGVERIEAVLTSLDARMDQQDALPGETPGRITLKNKGSIRIIFDGQKVHVAQLRLTGSGGTLAIGGWLSAKELGLTVDGQLELQAYAWLASQWLDGLQGRAWLKGTLRGSPQHPRWNSRIWLAGVVLLPVDRKVPVRIATAQLQLTDRELQVQRARVAIHTDEFALRGRVMLHRFRPQKLDITVNGKISAQVMRLASPRTFNHVTGRARALLRIHGDLPRPDLTGQIKLEPITFTLRGSGREFAIRGGGVKIANRRITIKELRGAVDDGTYVVDGRIQMGKTWPWDMNLTVRGQGIPVKKPRSYELELNAQLHYRMHGGKASLRGSVDVADGRFTESFDVVSRAFLKRRTHEQRPAFWETNSLLKDARLNVVIATQGPLIIKNNLADIRLEGNISLGGTPREPRIGGRIQAESGTFRIPFLRGEYTVQSGEIDFDHPFGFGETYVRIIGETTYTDVSETEHDINLTLEGPVSRIAIKLASNTGLNQSQIVMLLASGRTVDQLRRQMKGRDGSGGRSNNPLDAYDSSLKQVTGDFLSQLVAKPLQAWTKLDLVRLEMGTESFQVRVNKNLGRNVRLAGEAEFGLLGRQRQEGRIEVRVLDNLNVNAKARRLIPGEDTVIDEDRYQGRLELRYKIRLRSNLRRALGL